jgi:hypothetical protein
VSLHGQRGRVRSAASAQRVPRGRRRRLHIAAALTLTAANKAARPVQYAKGDAYAASVRSRYMVVSGLVILAFVIYHLLHFTALLPAVNGTTNLMLCLGQSWACAAMLKVPMATAAKANLARPCVIHVRV